MTLAQLARGRGRKKAAATRGGRVGVPGERDWREIGGERPPQCAAVPRGAGPGPQATENASEHRREQESGEDQKRHDRKTDGVAERIARRGGEDCMSTPNHPHGRALPVNVAFTFLPAERGVKNKIGTRRPISWANRT
jgi:hypothetical protein